MAKTVLGQYEEALLGTLARASRLGQALSEPERADLLARIAIVRAVVKGDASHDCTQTPLRIRQDAARDLDRLLAALTPLEYEVSQWLPAAAAADRSRFATLLTWVFFELRKPLSERYPNLRDVGEAAGESPAPRDPKPNDS